MVRNMCESARDDFFSLFKHKVPRPRPEKSCRCVSFLSFFPLYAMKRVHIALQNGPERHSSCQASISLRICWKATLLARWWHQIIFIPEMPISYTGGKSEFFVFSVYVIFVCTQCTCLVDFTLGSKDRQTTTLFHLTYKAFVYLNMYFKFNH